MFWGTQEGLQDVDGLRGMCQAQLNAMGLLSRLQSNLAATNETFRHFMFIVHKRVCWFPFNACVLSSRFMSCGVLSAAMRRVCLLVQLEVGEFICVCFSTCLLLARSRLPSQPHVHILSDARSKMGPAPCNCITD